MNPNEEMKRPAQRNLEQELEDAAYEQPMKSEPPRDQGSAEVAYLRAEVAELRQQAAAATHMAGELEKMRADFAQMMNRQAAAQPKLQAELAELRAHAKATPELYAEISQLKSKLEAFKAGATAAPPGQQAPTRTTPKIKDVLCRKFGGNEVYPGLGSGFEDFILEYEQAISTESLLNHSTWTSQIKASVLVNFLKDKAARFFHSNVTQWRIEKADFNYIDFKAKLCAEFGCKLNQVQLYKRLTSSKRPQDSWTEYLDYLKYVNRLMTGDHSLLLLETFCANACPELSNTLTAQIDRSNINYLLEADRILSLLVDLRGDGRKRGQPARAQPSSEQPDKKRNDGHHQENQPRGASNKQNSRNTNGQAHVASAKPAGKLVCYVCDEEGHRGPACPDLKKVKAAVKRQGQAHSATTTNTDTVSNDAEEGHLWLAASSKPNTRPLPASEWILDSGATHHLCTDRNLLFGVEPAKLTIKVANSETITSSLKGNCLLQTTVGGIKRSILLTNVYYCEQVGRNLLSLSRLRSRGLRFMFAETCTFLSPDGTVVGEATERGGLWVVNAATMGTHSSDAQALFVNVKKDSLQQWHERLGHVNFQDLLRMVNNNLANGVELANKKITFCMACAEGKQSRNAQPTQDTSDSAPTDELGAVICMDLKVDLKPDRNGHRHVLTIVDHASNYNQVFLLHTKDETFDKFLLFANEFQRQYDLKIKVLRTDGGGEFLNSLFKEYASRNGIRLQTTHPDTSASNGKAERFHRTLMNSARSMLWASSLPQRYWGDAVLYASYIRNRVPTRANADYKSPVDVLTGKHPRVSHILKFGSKCTVFVPRKSGRSLQKRAEKAIVLGISTTQKGYRLLIPRTKRFITSPDVQNIDKLDIQDPLTAEVLRKLHDEHSDASTTSTDTSVRATEQEGTLECNEQSEEDDEAGVPDDFGRPIPAGVLRRVFGKREHSETTDFELPQSFIDTFAGPAYAMMTIKASDREKEPQSVAEAKRSKHWAEWKAAMDKELAELDANGTWELVEAPDGANIVTSKWVYKMKFNSIGELERFKARLVARGFTQRYGVDFESTFSPVLKISSLRFIVMLAAIWKVKVRQGDVPNAYLKSALDKPIYLRPPTGTRGTNDHRVWLLLKGLYGLKQSGKLWNELIDSFLQAQGFERSRMDPCLYFLWHHGALCVLGLYVDDILIVSQNPTISDQVMAKLTERFDIKDLGNAQKCLGIWIGYSTDGITIHQQQTTLDLLAKMGMDQCKAASTPMDVNHRFFEENGDPFQNTTLYREAIGSLLWISNCTRPDIATATNCLSRFVSCPTLVHWNGVKRILRYLRGTTDVGLFYKFGNGIASKLQPIIYSDANWAGDSSSAKSTSGSVLQINGMTISWSSRKQTTVALSTMEAEYVAACSAVQDCIAIRQLLQELGLMQQTDKILLRVDNQSAIKSMENAVTTQRTRHLHIKYHFIRDAITNKKVQVEYCPTQQQLADIFTKATDRIIFGRMCSMLRLTSHA